MTQLSVSKTNWRVDGRQRFPATVDVCSGYITEQAGADSQAGGEETVNRKITLKNSIYVFSIAAGPAFRGSRGAGVSSSPQDQ